MTIAETTYASLEEVMNTVNDLAPLQVVGTRILQITEGDQFSAHELSQVIAADQALTAKMLRLSNSAYYSFPRRISTVRDAVVLLGFRAVRSATLASCVINTLDEVNALDGDDFWRFSVTVGLAAELLAHTGQGNADEAFTAGVIHNVGLLAMDQHEPAALRASHEYAREHGMSLHAAQTILLGYSDSELGGALALHWNFPQPLVDAVRDHSPEPGELPEEGSLTAHVVRARALALSIGYGDGLEATDPTPLPSEWLDAPLSAALRRAGGVERMRDRVEAFLTSTLG
ncbi:MAG: HDOD domain-containing protein [Dehalococcoidia bacterium]